MCALMLHSGGYEVSYDELKKVEIPDETDTYMPVPHYEVVDMIREVSHDQGFIIEDQSFGIKDSKINGTSMKGAKLFGTITLANGSTSEPFEDSILPIVGFRSSIDKTISLAFASGAGVFVCDNMMITGEIDIVRKHTPNVMNDAYKMIYKIINFLRTRHQGDEEFKARLKAIPITNAEGLDFLGHLSAHGFLPYTGGTSSPFALAMREWITPTFGPFAPRTLWSLYNACTYGLKKVQFVKAFEANRMLTREVMGVYV